MKKILAVLIAITFVFGMSTPAAFAGKAVIPFWQNGGNVTTLISIFASDGTTGMGTYSSTGATITIDLYAADTSSGFTVSPTSTPAGTTGQAFATASFQSTRGGVMQVDTVQIGDGTWSTKIWTTTGKGAYSATATKFGFGVVDTGTSGADEHQGWVAIYGGTNPAGFTVQLYDANETGTTPNKF